MKTCQVLVKNVPQELLREFDRVIKPRYPTRSEAIRQLMRDLVNGRTTTTHPQHVEVIRA